MDDIIYLQNTYKGCMLKILNNRDISFIDREFYSESPNWYTNNHFKSIIDTLVWLSLTDLEKKVKLDIEIDEYFV